jgi:hypothetical protein
MANLGSKKKARADAFKKRQDKRAKKEYNREQLGKAIEDGNFPRAVKLMADEAK